MNEEIIISVKNLTKDYGKGRGIFDVSFDIPKGATFGYCGTNGSGKTTTIRHIMGFIKPDKGEVKVKGLDAWKNAEQIKKWIGYVPGEIAFPDVDSGSTFLKIQADLLGITDMTSMLGKKRFNDLLGNMIVKNRGKLTLATRDDKRPEVTSAEADFMNEDN